MDVCCYPSRHQCGRRLSRGSKLRLVTERLSERGPILLSIIGDCGCVRLFTILGLSKYENLRQKSIGSQSRIIMCNLTDI